MSSFLSGGHWAANLIPQQLPDLPDLPSDAPVTLPLRQSSGSTWAWDLHGSTAVHTPRHMSPRTTKDREIHNCMHEQLGQIQDPKYNETKTQLPFLKSLEQKRGPARALLSGPPQGQAERLSPLDTPPHIRSRVVPTLRGEWTREPVFLSCSPACSRDKTLPILASPIEPCLNFLSGL